MRLAVLLSAVGCLLLVTHAQWLEREVVLPDSLSGLSQPGNFLFSPASNTILVSGDGSDCIIVLDAATAERVARIPLPGDATAMCLAAPVNKAYAVMPYAGAVAVIDVTASQVVATVPVSYAFDIAYNPVMNRVYCSYEYPGGVRVIDCAADTLVADIGLLSPVADLCYNPVGNKLYCMANIDEVAVINCDSDSVMRSIYSGLGPYDMLLNPLNNHLYISEAGDEDITVIDCGTDTVIRWMPSGGWPVAVCLASRHNKLYVADDGTNNLYVYNCNTNTFLRWFSIGGRSADVVYDSV
ncbi:YncE family protein, partial [candidate division WOR-3 bacterium]|nr:YncE family protein [candidate division WOR-3 bacterium]